MAKLNELLLTFSATCYGDGYAHAETPSEATKAAGQAIALHVQELRAALLQLLGTDPTYNIGYVRAAAHAERLLKDTE